MAQLRIITLEEHYAAPPYARGRGGAFGSDFARSVAERISDVTRFRLPEMDAAGIGLQVLSLPNPGVQAETDPDTAVRHAQQANDALAQLCTDHPGRFAAFAALPCQDPERAAEELQRCVTGLGFVGAMVNGHTNGVYLDDPRFEALWERLESLGVPLYLHPTFPPETPAVLAGHPGLAGPAWGWGMETASHALRLVSGGVFDRHPGAALILGHMGEGLPFALDRLDDRWAVLQHERPLRHAPSHYVRSNMYITTAGAESPHALQCALAAMGPERVLFSVDYPYQSAASATAFLAAAPLDPAVREALSHGNAARLLRLPTAL